MVRDFEEFYDFVALKGSGLDRVKQQYSDLYAAFETVDGFTSEKEREVELQVQELTSIREKVATIKRTTEEAIQAQDMLTANIEVASETRKAVLEREEQNRREIESFSESISTLKARLAAGSGWSKEQLEQKATLEKERDFLFKKMESKNSILQALRANVDKLRELLSEGEQKMQEMESTYTSNQKEIESLTLDAQRKMALKKKLDSKTLETQHVLKQTEATLVQELGGLEGERKLNLSIERDLREGKERMEGYLKDYDQILNASETLGREYEKQVASNNKIREDIEVKKTELTTKKSELLKVKKDHKKLASLKDLTITKIAEADIELASKEQERDKLQQKINELSNNEAKLLRKECESKVKQLVDVKQEKEVVMRKCTSTEKAARAVGELMQLNHNTIRNLQAERQILVQAVSEQQRQIQLLMSEKEKYEHEAEVTSQQYYTSLEELKLLEMQVKELQKKIYVDTNKLKQQQNAYETVRSDRNTCSKTLLASHEEINMLKKKFKEMNRTIAQLKDEISAKDHAMVKEHFHHHTVDKEKEMLRNEITKIRKQLQNSEQVVEAQQMEIAKLLRIVEDAEAECSRQENELQSIIGERNLLNMQVIKRTFEINQLYDKIKLQRANLRIGEGHYEKQLRQHDALKQQLIEVYLSQKSLFDHLRQINKLKRTMIRRDKEMLTERTKIRAIEDEIDRPINVHRWRQLEASDPRRHEMMRQIQSLQKALVDKTDEVTRKDLLIQ